VPDSQCYFTASFHSEPRVPRRLCCIRARGHAYCQSVERRFSVNRKSGMTLALALKEHELFAKK
jgi:hypothetical protein